jgi:hypothetical protein
MKLDLVDFHTKAHAEHKESGNGLLRPIMKSSNSSSEFLRRAGFRPAVTHHGGKLRLPFVTQPKKLILFQIFFLRSATPMIRSSSAPS